MPVFRVKRVHDESSKGDGYRVLVDRLWPRGVSKTAAQLNAWNKDVAPSPELRKWFNHEPEKFSEFSKKYEDELSSSESVDTFLRSVNDQEVVTLLYGAKNPSVNHAVVLRHFLQSKGSS
ncbi:DUF488 domain-containing protein [Patescibacteria group bacterium]|nr:MAG: DUF488 domain-containing protein [Patescibacteria group bacterium]